MKKQLYIQKLMDGRKIGYSTGFLHYEVQKISADKAGTLKTTGDKIKIGLVSHYINDRKRWKKISTEYIKYRFKVFHLELEGETLDETTHIIIELIKGDAVRKFYGNKIWTISTTAI